MTVPFAAAGATNAVRVMEVPYVGEVDVLVRVVVVAVVVAAVMVTVTELEVLDV